MIHDVVQVSHGRPASTALAHAVAAAKGTRPLAPVTVVVPSNLAGVTARRLLAAGAVGPGGIANVSFLTPFRLAELLSADLLPDTHPLTNPVLRAAVRATLAEQPGPFAPVADHHATESALVELYAELSSLSPDALDRIGRRGTDGARAAVAFHRHVARRLSGRYHGEPEVAAAVTIHPDLAGALEPFGHLVWHLPEPLTAALTTMLAAVFDAGPTTVVVAWTGVADADEAVRTVCERVGVPLEAWPAAPPAPPVADRIVSVTDADEEVRAVVRRTAALAEQGVALDRIGVFHPVSDPYVTMLEQHLAAAGIPANGPTRRRLADSVAGRTLLGALALPAERWRRDRVLALASGAPLRPRDVDVRPAAWERLSREAGIVAELHDWRSKLDDLCARLRRLLADTDAASQPGRARSLERAIGDVGQLRAFVDLVDQQVSAVAAARGWAATAHAAQVLLRALLGPPTATTSWPEPEQVAYAQVERVLERLGALDELEPDPAPAVFLRALAAELDGGRGRSGRFGHGVVYGPLASAVGHDLDAVFVLGCAEGLCPAPRRDDSLLPDASRLLAAGELDIRARRIHDQHRWFLAALAAAPPGRRTLTHPRGDLRAGRHHLPSRWLLDTATALAGTTVHATDFPRLGAPIVDVVASHARGVLDTPVPATVEERDLAVLDRHLRARGSIGAHPVGQLVERGVRAQVQRRSADFGEWDGNLTGQPVPSATAQLLSPSRLEAWAACGYRYFLAHVLDLADRDDPERIVEVSPLDRGSAIHEVLERFYREVIDEGAPEPDEPWSDDRRARLAAIAEEVFDDLERRGRTGRPVLWQLQRTELLALLDGFLDADDRHRAERRCRPEQVELAFGLDAADPVVLGLEGGARLSFRGRADRVDRTEDGRLAVFDYKTGKGGRYKTIREGDPVQGGATLQLGLYAEAAVQLLGAAGAEAHYWMIHPEGNVQYGYRWDEARRARMLEVLEAIVGGIERGLFPAVPGEWNTWRRTNETCTYCAFDSVCSRDRGEHAAAKVDAPELRCRDPLTWEPAT